MYVWIKIVTLQDVRCLVGLYFSLYYIYIYIYTHIHTHTHTRYTDCFLCSHTDTASTPAVQRYPFLNKFSSRATARFQCWKSIYPLLKLPRRRGPRWSRLLSNGRSHEIASSRALWKEGESRAAGVFPRVFSHDMWTAYGPKVCLHWTRQSYCYKSFELYVINRARHQLERGFRPGLEREFVAPRMNPV